MPFPILNKLKNHFAFFAILILTGIFAYPYQEGIGPFDAGDYCKCAHQLTQGKLDLSNVYCNRIGSYLPFAMVMKLTGFSPHLTWVNVAELMLLVSLLYFALKNYNKEIALIACAMVGFAPLLLEWSGRLYGDIMAVLTCNLCILWIWHKKYMAKQSAGIVSGAVLALMWFIALLTKETAFFYLFPIGCFFILDNKNGELRRFWNGFLFFILALSIVFIAFYAIQTGNPFYRLHLVETNPSVSTENYAGAGWQMILLRITILPLKFLLETYSLFLVFFLSLFQIFSKAEDSKEKFFKIFVVSTLAVWWLGTQSFQSWNPVSLTDRLWMPLMVPMAIGTAHVLHSIHNGDIQRYANLRTKVILLILLVAVPITGYLNEASVFSAGRNNSLTFLVPRMGLLLLAYLAIFQRDFVRNLIEILHRNYLAAFAIGFLLLYNFSQTIFTNRNEHNYFADRSMINLVLERNQKATILCENSVYRNHGIYYGFEPEAESLLQFLDWNSIDTLQLNNIAHEKELYLLINKDRLWYSENKFSTAEFYRKSNDRIPTFVLNPGNNWEQIKENSKSVLYRYRF